MRFSNDVFVFNWKGELVNRLKLDRETQTIAIDGDNYLFDLLKGVQEMLSEDIIYLPFSR